MRRKALALSLAIVLLASIISGCIGSGGTKTITVTKTVGPEEDSKAPTATSTSPTSTQMTDTTSTTLTQVDKDETTWQTVPKPESCNNWREDFEKAIYCALTPSTLQQLGQMLQSTIAPQATTPSEKVYYALSYGTVTVAIDDVKENRSMEIGHYYDIKAPLETLESKGGSRADIALLYTGFFLNIFDEAYIFYAIENETKFDVEAGFYYEDINYTTLWPYPFPLPFTQYERLAAMHGHFEIRDVIMYRIKKQPTGEIMVEKRYIPIKERAEWDSQFHKSGMYLTAQNLQKLQEDMNALFGQAMKQQGYNYKHDPNLQYDYQAKVYRYTYTFGDFFYSKPFHKEFATGMLIALLSGSGVGNDLAKYSKYHIEVAPSLDDLVLMLYVK
ncbi:hypothetical protein APY94_04060 [Thermococcus celericrescens]|uniref:Lipoprotein n=1 Tax=Thermococcus celericrescens TaxID=227598 RepID=A0A124EBG6_9EURY|nr:hypothetical protein [Thermococcus celericrescens]KUH33912.1 hypothetical protein APY94_04060 [Thermococcus celericrescens]